MAFDSSILKPLTLRRGAGKGWENGLCFMEAAAWLAGEEATDRPKCACPVLGKFGIAINDLAGHDQRQRLLPLAYRMAGTVSAEHYEARTAFLAKYTRRAMIAFFEEHRGTARMYDATDRGSEWRDIFATPSHHPAEALDLAMHATIHIVRKYQYQAVRIRVRPLYPEDLSPYLGYGLKDQMRCEVVTHRMAAEVIIDELIEILEHAIWMGPNGQSEWERYVEPAKKLGEFAAKKLKPHPKQYEHVMAKGAPTYGY